MKTVSISLLLIGIFIIMNYRSEALDSIDAVNSSYSYKEDIWIIDIEKIKLRHIITLSSIYSKNINGVVLFKEYGRPDRENSNTIIGAHSGIGPNALFNDIDRLEVGDDITICYKRVYFTYMVVNKYQVDEHNLSPLNKGRNTRTLTLMTCDRNNLKKRTIVVAELI